MMQQIGGVGIQFKTNQQLEAEEQAERDRQKAAEDRQHQAHVTSLAAYGMMAWQASKEAKAEIEATMLDCIRRRKGKYSAEKLASIREQGGSEIFMMVTDEKCSAVTSWLSDILFPAEDKPWGIKPTPAPDLAPQQMSLIKQAVVGEMQQRLVQEVSALVQTGEITTHEQARSRMMQAMEARAEELGAEIRAEMEKAAKEARDRVETKLHDVVVESGWEDAVSDALDDIATFPSGIVKGPILRQKKRLQWKPDFVAPPAGEDTAGMDQGFRGIDGSPVEVKEDVCIDFCRVSPLDVYPFPNARTAEDGLIERHKLTRRYLTSLIGVRGFDEDAIRMVLKDYGHGHSNWLSVSIDNARERLEDRPHEDRSPDSTIDALQIWCNVQGLRLLQHGLPADKVEDPFKDYAIEMWLIGRYVIKVELNGDPLGRVPYNFASFRKRNGSIWGSGPPEIIMDSQDACNAAARAMINNMGISSGPQVDVDISQIPPGEKITEMYPWKIWQSDSSRAMGSSSSQKPPIRFFIPPSVANELIAVYKFFSDEADSKTGVPKYSYGGEASSGALGTATGFSMMMGNAARGIKNVVRNIDKGIIQPTIERTHQFQLMFFRDPEYFVGDVKIIARGSSALVAKEQAAVRRNELLGVVVGSEIILDIIGKKGLASMLHEVFKGADFKDNEIVPTKKEMIEREAAEQQAMMEQASIEQSGQKQIEQGTQTDPAGNKAGGKDFQTA